MLLLLLLLFIIYEGGRKCRIFYSRDTWTRQSNDYYIFRLVAEECSDLNTTDDLLSLKVLICAEMALCIAREGLFVWKENKN